MRTLKEDKAIVREYLGRVYTDSDLAKALDHARSGKMSFVSCCCLIGIPTADHELQGMNIANDHHHYIKVAFSKYAKAAEEAFFCTGFVHGRGVCAPSESIAGSEPLRRARIIPILKAEIRRRMQTVPLAPWTEDTPYGEMLSEVCEASIPEKVNV